MKQIIISVVLAPVLFSCNNADNKNQFTVNGQLKNAADQKVYLEEVFFNKKDPEVLDTAEIKGGKFSLNGLSTEEGIYRIRLEKMNRGFLFINDAKIINFTADLNDVSLSGTTFTTPANSSLKNFISINDSLMKSLNSFYLQLQQLEKNGAKPGDSIFTVTQTSFNTTKEEATKFCFKYADTVKSPSLALFTATSAPVTLEQLQKPLQNLAQRFPKNNSIIGFTNFAKQQLSMQQQQTQGAKVSIGSMAPDITMNDVNDKPFSLSQLKGKYVLVDFWASWCGPCRAENPNVVAAYNQFKDKNFTVLGVSLDQNKASWLKAIKDDNLTWQHISDLKYWSSAAVPLYGFNGIPYNVLVDPEGKVIATELRGAALMAKLSEVLK
jgi:peroxiredoxin